MRKLFYTVIFTLTAFALLVSCAPRASEPEGSLDSLLDKLYDTVGDELAAGRTVISAENAAYYLGTEAVPFTDALASEPMISAIPHLVVLLRLEKNADVAAAKTALLESADPYRWICVGVEQDKVRVDSIGSLVILVMAENSESYIDAFRALAE